MAKVGAQRAAELTGKSKSTIQRAMKQGKLSFELDGNKRRLIDVSELERVYGLVSTSDKNEEQAATPEAVLKEAEQMIEMERLKMKVKMLESQLDEAKDQILDLKAQRDQWQKQAAQVLLTSQASQEQAKDLKDELERRRRAAVQKRQAMERKKAEMAQRVQNMKAGNQNAATAQAEKGENQIGALWQKLRGRA
tara:strand:- start:148 stop:729 length:582 start_codon:yes stop_codon:yes gene_type:complete